MLYSRHPISTNFPFASALQLKINFAITMNTLKGFCLFLHCVTCIRVSFGSCLWPPRDFHSQQFKYQTTAKARCTRFFDAVCDSSECFFFSSFFAWCKLMSCFCRPHLFASFCVRCALIVLAHCRLPLLCPVLEHLFTYIKTHARMLISIQTQNNNQRMIHTEDN